ncbi:uncharacterized protein LOC129742542 [Uranotaenia lowii]|uniref:uncharacterized protein LOC129742542 n=1 Tax=Uranotaenia lowii TaxID=190385 RepID=UPI002478FAAC|nr:uncharacterized protein LOC129742542 [Uranotaenia lowii]
MANKLQDRSFVDDYFANLNDLSRKISLDIGEVKATYEHIWDDLSREEQAEIINETLIKPELTLKYFDNFSTSSDSFDNIIGADENSDDRKVNLYDGRSLHTFQYLKTGRKVIHDDSVGLFRDEHSFPFSHKTKSQINLTIFPLNKDKFYEKKTNLAKKLEKTKYSATSRDSTTTAPLETKTISKVVAEQASSYDEENNVIQALKSNGATNYLTNFICGQAIGGTSPIIVGDEVDEQSLENIGFDDDKINLFRHSSRSDSLHQAQSSSVEEDDKNFDELNSLLGTSKGFDFLNNW